MKKYKVYQRAEVWYVTDVVASSPEMAETLVQEDGYEGEWSIDYETCVMVDDFDVHEVE